MAAGKVKGTMSTTRLRKVVCPQCGCIARMSRGAIVKAGLPWCSCGTDSPQAQMTCADLEDLAVVKPDDPRFEALRHAEDAYVEKSLAAQHRTSRFTGRCDPDEQRAYAHENAYAACLARDAAQFAVAAFVKHDNPVIPF